MVAVSGHASPLAVPQADLQRCHELLGHSTWDAFRGQRVFLTGGTGFVGKWLLASLLDANERFGLACRVTVLSRDPAAFLDEWPGLATEVEWLQGDVRDFPVQGISQDLVVHAATDVVASATPSDVFSTCLDGTKRVLELARLAGAKKLLLVSSGAIYGPLPPGMTHVPETHLGGPDPLQISSAYAEGKRAAEWLTTQAQATLSVTVARLFAAVGPHLPLDKHFAIGNFLRAAMNDEEIIVQGDGTPYRSYIYAADMAAWLWAVLLKGQRGRAYNVGAAESVSIAELAQRVCLALDRPVRVAIKQAAKPATPPSHYAPDIGFSRKSLGLPEPLRLDEAIARTARWHSSRIGAQSRSASNLTTTHHNSKP